MTTSLTKDGIDPHNLLARWDAQQTAFIKYRDLRFDAIVSTIARVSQPKPRVLDIACGPGSLTRAVLAGIPDASVVAVDKDPILLEIARDVLGSDDRVDILDTDLDEPDWAKTIVGPFDAIVSSTALHWLRPEILSRLYLQFGELVREGGVFLNGDHLQYDETAQPTFRRIAKEDDEFNQKLAFDNGTDNWDDWWKVAEAYPPYAEAAIERKKRWEGKDPGPKVTLGYHLETLRCAGFAEVGTVWQYLDDYVLCAVR